MSNAMHKLDLEYYRNATFSSRVKSAPDNSTQFKHNKIACVPFLKKLVRNLKNKGRESSQTVTVKVRKHFPINKRIISTGKEATSVMVWSF